MAYNSVEALREAGIIGGQMSPELEEFYGSLTQQETEVLISTKSRLVALFPDVAAHSQQWSTPEAAEQGFDAAMLCACGLWAGSGQAN
ncbi:StsA-related sactipeptide RiPP [Actinoplanes sp. NPDC051494]|uniref:StsA-related sactipeptide RiPP n=1 Tax=Actinoplanes sp. NPDC051494 TaxID=3363907 RepID=UPI0037A9E325